MKLPLLCAWMVPVVLMAQIPQPPPPAAPSPMPQRPPRMVYRSNSVSDEELLPQNFQVVLTITDKDAAPLEISVTTAKPMFQANLSEPSLAFSGTLTFAEGDEVRVSYTLGWETQVSMGNGAIQYKTSSVQGSALMKLGQAVDVFRAGSRQIKLTVRALNP